MDKLTKTKTSHLNLSAYIIFYIALLFYSKHISLAKSFGNSNNEGTLLHKDTFARHQFCTIELKKKFF